MYITLVNLVRCIYLDCFDKILKYVGLKWYPIIIVI